MASILKQHFQAQKSGIRLKNHKSVAPRICALHAYYRVIINPRPMRGATGLVSPSNTFRGVSIHAPTQGATVYSLIFYITICYTYFFAKVLKSEFGININDNICTQLFDNQEVRKVREICITYLSQS